jgi:hypothetical protein
VFFCCVYCIPEYYLQVFKGGQIVDNSLTDWDDCDRSGEEPNKSEESEESEEEVEVAAVACEDSCAEIASLNNPDYWQASWRAPCLHGFLTPCSGGHSDFSVDSSGSSSDSGDDEGSLLRFERLALEFRESQSSQELNVRYSSPVRSMAGHSPRQQGTEQHQHQYQHSPTQLSVSSSSSPSPTTPRDICPPPTRRCAALLDALRAAHDDPHTQKQLMGECLYPLIRMQEPQLAGKITGMLLEKSPWEVLYWIEVPEALQAMVAEALNVLHAASSSSSSSLSA